MYYAYLETDRAAMAKHNELMKAAAAERRAKNKARTSKPKAKAKSE